MTMDQTPMLLQQGYGAIFVAFDVWGIAHLVQGNLAQGRQYAAETEKPEGEANGAASNGSASNGSVSNGAVSNGTVKGDETVVANGKALTS
jgi:4-hydroxy-2-oxoheptanedioate aldolase